MREHASRHTVATRSHSLAGTLAVAIALGACGTAIERNGIADPALAEQATLKSLPGVRFWGDEVPADPIAEIRRRTPNIPPIAQAARRAGGRPIIETLALSGGGSDGAFGAGVMAGWTERGDRPEFEIVTGVSAGAIIAPFAFLGSKYDGDLQRIWTEYKANDVVTAQLLPGLFGGPALTDTGPLARLVAKYVDHAMLKEIATEYRRGRILMVLTTNLDAQRPVVWNMGEIALIGSDEALDLFRKVILASSAIPGAFPPVNIPVEVNGKTFEEMHVDGGTTRELFVLPVQAPFKAFDALYPQPPIRRVYIVKNGRLTPETEVVKGTTLSIASRAIATLIKSQNWSELYRIYRITKDGGADFNLMAVPKSFTQTTTEFYDPKYQKALYAEGVASGRAAAWLKAPPGQTPITPITSRRGGKLAREQATSTEPPSEKSTAPVVDDSFKPTPPVDRPSSPVSSLQPDTQPSPSAWAPATLASTPASTASVR